MDFLSLCSKYVRQKWNERVSHSVVSDSLWPHRLQPTRLRCPWNSPGKNIGVGSPIFSPRESSKPRNWNQVSCITGNHMQILYHLHHIIPIFSDKPTVVVQSLGHVRLCDPMHCSTPGFPSFTSSRTLPTLMSIELVTLPNHLKLCYPPSPPVLNLAQH